MSEDEDSMNALERFNPEEVIRDLVLGTREIKFGTRGSPGTALAIVASRHSQSGKNLPVLAQALDAVLAQIPDPELARRLLEEHLLPEAQEEMIAIHSDRLSVVVQIASPNQVLAALARDVRDGNSSLATAGLLLRQWAMNLCSRDDWDEILDMEFLDVPLRHLLLAMLFQQAGEDLEEITDDIWESIGLDADDSVELLRELLEDDALPTFSELEISQAQALVRMRRASFETATRVLVDEVEI